ncbi:MAG: hypothetical protein AAGK05_13345, partial [Pseudomonadota bacterium]
DSTEPLGSKVVNGFIDIVRQNSDVTKHHFFIDNFFTSHDLILKLSGQNVKVTGTIRENRTGGANRLIDSRKDIRKTSRGTTDYRCDGKVYVNCWNDNSIVYTASNTFMHEPMHEVKRWKKNAGQVNVKQPDIVYQYNKGMGGVDLFDRLVSSYRPVLRSRKWWWPLFSQVLNTSIVAAWKVHCALSEKAMSHLEFRRSIVLCLLKEVKVAASAGRHVPLPSAVSIHFA